MDFDGGEVRYEEREQEVVIPFRTGEGEGTTASVRLAGAANLVNELYSQSKSQFQLQKAKKVCSCLRVTRVLY